MSIELEESSECIGSHEEHLNEASFVDTYRMF